ncbi:MAG: AI-2E family transporter [Vulcanimicrobiaceae bacterium]
MNGQRIAVVIVWAAIAALVWYLHDTLLLVFAGTLVALMIYAGAERLARLVRIPMVWTVWLVVAASLGVLFVTTALVGNAVAVQVAELRTALPAAMHNAIAELRAAPLGAWFANNMPDVSAIIPDTAHLLAGATGVLSGALGALTGVLIIIFVGIAGALDPQIYVNGLVLLFPARYRPRLRTAIVQIGGTLRTWMIARVLTMAVTGTLVTIGLTLLRVPLAGSLGILAGVLAFIPNIGAFIAAAPAVMLAFVASPRLALAVLAMYLLVHTIDDFIVSPLIERQVVKLPPILTLVAQIVLGIAAGAVGIMLAAPLVAAAIVLVRRLWVEDVADLL